MHELLCATRFSRAGAAGGASHVLPWNNSAQRRQFYRNFRNFIGIKWRLSKAICQRRLLPTWRSNHLGWSAFPSFIDILINSGIDQTLSPCRARSFAGLTMDLLSLRRKKNLFSSFHEPSLPQEFIQVGAHLAMEIVLLCEVGGRKWKITGGTRRVDEEATISNVS